MAQWEQIFKTRSERGQSIQEFCKEQGISRNAYFYWQKKLRETACTELARRETATPANKIPEGWAQIQPNKAQKEETAITIEVGGCLVRVRAGADTEQLAAVCRTLKTLC